MNINLQSFVRHCTPDVRTWWISFKFSGFHPWQNLMQVSRNAIILLNMSALDLRKQTTRDAWGRSVIITLFYIFQSGTSRTYFLLFLVHICISLEHWNSWALVQYTEIVPPPLWFHLSVSFSILDENVSIPHILKWPFNWNIVRSKLICHKM